MPRTTPERAARWPGLDGEAIAYLQANGWVLHRDYTWSHPEDRPILPREMDAILYLLEEWDFGGLRISPEDPADG